MYGPIDEEIELRYPRVSLSLSLWAWRWDLVFELRYGGGWPIESLSELRSLSLGWRKGRVYLTCIMAVEVLVRKGLYCELTTLCFIMHQYERDT